MCGKYLGRFYIYRGSIYIVNKGVSPEHFFRNVIAFGYFPMRMGEKNDLKKNLEIFFEVAPPQKKTYLYL